MFRRPWRTATATALTVGASAYAYRAYTSRRVESFDYRVRTTQTDADGKPVYATQTLPLTSMDDVNRRLTEHASFHSKPRPGGIMWKHATAQLASNDPIEDAHTEAIVERDQQDGDYLFFAVMDGHSGTHTSRLLSHVLIPAIGLQLKELADSPSTYESSKLGRTSFLESIASLFSRYSAPKAPGSHSVAFDADPKYVSLALQTAFAMVDSEIVNAPLRLVAQELLAAGLKPTDPAPDLSKHPMALPTMLPALSGSCALLALIDTAHRDLYVACTGDCRAVAGVWEPSADGAGGVWRVDVLSDDQTGRNPSELKRMQSEHPKDEEDTVINRGRVLGGLEPSRAFGDARYKWPRHVQEMLSRVFLEGNDRPMRKMPADFKTPPYVTAQPVITHRKLDSLPLAPLPPYPAPSVLTPLASTQTQKAKEEETQAKPKSDKPIFKFLILATDGLWDELKSEEAVALVGAHLSGLRSPRVARSALSGSTRVGNSAGIDGKDASIRSGRREGEWAFVDENPGTHLLRNAFGGADEGRLRRLMSYRAPVSRRYRDDCTVTVVWWEEGGEGKGAGSAEVGVSGKAGVVEKAKL